MENNIPDYLSLPTKELLVKFGAGDHKPGSGSAAALLGMLSSQLIGTVISLTDKEERQQHYQESLPKLRVIQKTINQQIYPELEQLFQEDSIQFDKTIKLREARDEEKNWVLKMKLAEEALKELIPSTEIPIRIAKLCNELARFAIVAFDNGFKSARGDSCVGLNSAVSAIGSCLSIVDLNLLSFKPDEWSEKIKEEAEQLRILFKNHSLEANSRLETLKSESRKKDSLYSEIELVLRKSGPERKIDYRELEETARKLQNTMWKYRGTLWKKNLPEDPMDLLRPDVVFKKVFGYQFLSLETLGQHQLNGSQFEIAGQIDKTNK